jgi:hypothetical protein
MTQETDSSSELRRRTNAHLARVVDIGLGYLDRLGYPHAKAYLREHGVPAENVNRVLSNAGACRNPDAEDRP